MRYPRVRAFVVGGLLLWLVTSTSHAQRFQPFGPLDFTQDWQPFAPAEISSYGGGVRPKTGFFFTYDRLNLWVDRPQTAMQPHKFDRATGTRIDFGYMSKSNNGWVGELMSVGGPNVYDEPTDRQRDVITINQSGISPTNGQPVIDVPAIVAQHYPNGYWAENVASLKSFEFSKMWRLKRLHGDGKAGSHVELFAGGRLATIKTKDSYNYNQGELFDAFNPGGPGLYPTTDYGIPNPFPPEGLEPDYNAANRAALFGDNRYTPLGVVAENTIFGPQFGLRWFRQRGRWNISAEGRGFVAVNRQKISGGFPIQEAAPVGPQYPSAGSSIGYPLLRGGSTSITSPPQTEVSPNPALVPDVPDSRQVHTYNVHQWKWAPAGDVRVNVSYELTKSFALEAGWEWLYFANGIARGKSDGVGNPFTGLDNQDMMFTGWTVGFVLNR